MRPCIAMKGCFRRSVCRPVSARFVKIVGICGLQWWEYCESPRKGDLYFPAHWKPHMLVVYTALIIVLDDLSVRRTISRRKNVYSHWQSHGEKPGYRLAVLLVCCLFVFFSRQIGNLTFMFSFRKIKETTWQLEQYSYHSYINKA